MSTIGDGDSLRINVSELRRRAGNQRDFHREVPATGLELSTSRVPDGATVIVDATLESLTDGVTVQGEVRAFWAGECRRCLEEVSGELRSTLNEVFADRPQDEDVYPVDGDHVDLWPMVHDALVLALPIVPLCREDCPGPDPEAFPVTVAVDSEEAGEPPRDPRWAALEGLRLEPEAGSGEG